MKKLITLLSLAVTPVLFAQEQKMSSQEIEQKKQAQIEAKKASEAEASLKETTATTADKATKAEIKATNREKRNSSPNSKALRD